MSSIQNINHLIISYLLLHVPPSNKTDIVYKLNPLSLQKKTRSLRLVFFWLAL
ncbi:hypothetical protein LPICM02_320029 [Pseudolactococcus piscium]|nr:hypothetical protein LPICM02_320029 [Lactococcus piscium]